MSGATSLASVLDGDAPIKGDNMSAVDRILRTPVPPRVPAQLPRAPPKRPRHQHSSVVPRWQDGTCNDSRLKGWCSRVPDLAHQCAKCLSQEHGAHACQRPAALAPRHGGSWGGRAKGKGKGGGKGGKGGRQS